VNPTILFFIALHLLRGERIAKTEHSGRRQAAGLVPSGVAECT